MPKIKSDSDHTFRKVLRCSRACDQCRRLRRRCVPGDEFKCSGCLMDEAICSTTAPSQKRGPPKGYLSSLELRLNQVEALFGVLLKLKDPHVDSILSTISTDARAKLVFNMVKQGPYGLNHFEACTDDEALELFYHKGTRDLKHTQWHSWQDRLIRLHTSQIGAYQLPSPISSSGAEGITEWTPVVHERVPPPPIQTLVTLQHPIASSAVAFESSPSTVDFSSSPSIADYSESFASIQSSEIGHQALIPRLDPVTFDEDDSLVVKGAGVLTIDKRSTIHYVGKSSGLHLLSKIPRDDDLYLRGVWRVPSSNNLDDTLVKGTPLVEEQRALLQYYIKHVLPAFPILSEKALMKKYNETFRVSANTNVNDMRTFEILLLSIYATVLCKVTTQDDRRISGNCSAELCFQKAAKLLGENQYKNGVETIQALLLLARYQYGTSHTENGRGYAGMAICLAQDLGMHKPSEEWEFDGKQLFTEKEHQERKNIWAGCVITDVYLSLCSGQPMLIHENDRNTPKTILAPHADYVDAKQLLYPIIGDIISKTYATRKDEEDSKSNTALQYASRLKNWFDLLPNHLSIPNLNVMLNAPLGLLSLHADYWLAVILAYHPIICSLLTRGSSFDSSGPLAPWHHIVEAAEMIHQLVKAWKVNHALKDGASSFAHCIFHAGIVWITALVSWNDAPKSQCIYHLGSCIEILGEMGRWYPRAGQYSKYLAGSQTSPLDLGLYCEMDSFLGPTMAMAVDELLALSERKFWETTTPAPQQTFEYLAPDAMPLRNSNPCGPSMNTGVGARSTPDGNTTDPLMGAIPVDANFDALLVKELFH